MNRLIKYNPLGKIINNYFYDSKLPINLNLFYQFGSILGICLILQIITGVLLAFNYIPEINQAFDSIEYIMREVNYGYLIRYLHANGASFIFILGYMHILRSLLYGSYIGTRKNTWRIGVIIFLFLILTAFIGYSLVLGQMSYWAVTVITSLLTVIPYIGQDLVELIWGGYTVGGATLTRFYALHYLFPFIIAALAIMHLITAHYAGSSNPLGVSIAKVTKGLINFHPYYTWKDIVGFIAFFLSLFFFVFFYPDTLSHPDNYIPADPLVTPPHIVPEFYLLAFYSLLRSIPDKTLGVIALFSAILVLLIIPNLHFGLINTSLFRPIYKLGLFIFVLNFLLLSWVGQTYVEAPYIGIGQILTFIYFGFFLIFIPLISLIETLFYIIITTHKK